MELIKTLGLLTQPPLFSALIIINNTLYFIHTTVTNPVQDDSAGCLSSFLSHKMLVPEIINSYSLKYTY